MLTYLGTPRNSESETVLSGKRYMNPTLKVSLFWCHGKILKGSLG